MKCVLIGAGNLGSRHLQALASIPELEIVYAIEPREEARTLAATRWQDALAAQDKKLIFTDMATLKAESPRFDIAVISSLSTDRLQVLSEVLGLGVSHILCEKILFQSVAEYRQALEMTKQKQAHIYVNYIFRYVPVYTPIKHQLALSKAPLTMRVDVGNIGLGCNLVHILDLFEFITGRSIETLAVDVDKPLLPCKRGEQFIEFTCTVNAATSAGDQLSVYTQKDTTILAKNTFAFAGKEYVIDEEKNTWLSNENPIAIHPLEMPYVSKLTSRVIPEILAGNCLLPKLEESFSLNCLMLNAFNQSIYGNVDEHTRCPIT